MFSVYFCLSVDFTNKTVEDFHLLLSDAILVLDCFVDDDLFNQRIQQFSGQFRWISVSLNKRDPLFCIGSRLLFSGKFCFELIDLF